MTDNAKSKLIFALDVDNLEDARNWVEQLQGQVGVFKIGKQLFTKCGPEVVNLVQDAGADVFLDLKYHDIPNTVAMAGLEALRLGVKMFNVHALGGFEMMAKLVAEVDKVCPRDNPDRPVLLAVTILTSSNEETLRGVGIDRPVEVRHQEINELTTVHRAPCLRCGSNRPRSACRARWRRVLTALVDIPICSAVSSVSSSSMSRRSNTFR